MGQKVNPHGLRVGVIKDWESRWYADPESFSDNLVEDYKIREFLKKKLYHAGISKIEIERSTDRVKVLVYTAKPGVVIQQRKFLLTSKK
jgi:small subunit ribosomal protein S3